MQVMAATTKIAAAPAKGTVKLQAKPKPAAKPAPKPAAAPAKKTGTQKLAAPKPGSTVKKAVPASTTVKKVAAAPASTVKKTAGTQKAGTQNVGTVPSKKVRSWACCARLTRGCGSGWGTREALRGWGLLKRYAGSRSGSRAAH